MHNLTPSPWNGEGDLKRFCSLPLLFHGEGG